MFKIKRDCENPKRFYVYLRKKRYIFDRNLKKPYVGWDEG